MSSSTKKVGVIVLGLALLFALGFRVGHPQSGLSTAMGSAESSLVIYKHGVELAKDQKAIVNSGNPSTSPSLGLVANVGDGYYDVNTGKFLEQIAKEDVAGKLIIVIPFLGTFFGLIGL